MVYLLNLALSFEYLDTYFRLALVLGAVETAIFGVSLAHLAMKTAVSLN